MGSKIWMARIRCVHPSLVSLFLCPLKEDVLSARRCPISRILCPQECKSIASQLWLLRNILHRLPPPTLDHPVTLKGGSRRRQVKTSRFSFPRGPPPLNFLPREIGAGEKLGGASLGQKGGYLASMAHQATLSCIAAGAPNMRSFRGTSSGGSGSYLSSSVSGSPGSMPTSCSVRRRQQHAFELGSTAATLVASMSPSCGPSILSNGGRSPISEGSSSSSGVWLQLAPSECKELQQVAEQLGKHSHYLVGLRARDLIRVMTVMSDGAADAEAGRRAGHLK